jgi:putative DNA primase/helicase
VQVQLEKVPQYLKDNDQFCNWRYELRDGNQTKVLYMSGTKRKANVDDPTTFVVFDTAASATGYDGIGIRVSGGIVGIDLDHCMEDGNLPPWAQTIVERFDATYIEISPSGEGIRVQKYTAKFIA